jgi:hypothetical protein
VAEQGLRQLNSDLPYSGFEFVDGELMFPDGKHEVNVRYRGDFLVHWGFEKKSFRIRTKDKELFDGLQTFNLVVPKFPEQVNNYLGYRLAAELGLMAPRCELVNVMLNGSNLGLYEYTEQLDEGTLRRHGQAVGEIFAGDLIAKDSYQGVTNNVFELPELWEQLVDSKRRIPGSREPLYRLVRLLNTPPSEASVAELGELLDMDAFGAFGAFEVLTQTHHFDEIHNWRLAWNPWTQKFRPIVWDATPWIPEMRPLDGGPIALDLVISRLAMWLHRSGDFLAARQRAITEFFHSGRADRFLADVRDTLTRAEAALAYDPNIRPTNPAEIQAGMRSFEAFVQQTLREVRAAYVDSHSTVRWSRTADPDTMALEVTGRHPVDAVVLRCETLVQRPSRVLLRHRRDGKTIDTDLTGGVQAQNDTLRIPARLLEQLEPCFRFLPGQVLRQHTLLERPGYYELIIDGLSKLRLGEVDTQQSDALVRAEQSPALKPQDLLWIYRPTVSQPVRAPASWSGKVEITGIREVREDVAIAPGSTITMLPGASLIFRGRVTANGTKDQPIRFQPQDAAEGLYGTVALAGPGCDGSVFRHCEWRGGSSATLGTHAFPGSISIHDCRDVELRNCQILGGAREAQLVHVAHADAEFQQVAWHRAGNGGLVAEMARIHLDACTFTESGSDALKLLASNAILLDCDVAQAKDAAIRAEDGSTVLLIRTKLRRSGQGADIRDGSTAELVNCELLACGQPVLAQQKHWRQPEGGRVHVCKSIFAKNSALSAADHRSRLRIEDCQLDGADTPSLQLGRKHKDNRAQWAACSDAPEPMQQAPLPFPEGLDALGPAARAAWQTVRTDMRGGNRER